MTIIYKAKGKAREYSPLGLNVYKGCDHDCLYCYNDVKDRHSEKLRRKDLIPKLKDQLAKETGLTDQIMLSFMGDPYCLADVELRDTRRVLETLLPYQPIVSILTKGGLRMVQDMDLIRQFETIEVGATVVLWSRDKWEEWEPNAPSPGERIIQLREVAESGLSTWISLEPAIDPDETLEVIDRTIDFVDKYKMGRLNYFPEVTEGIDWTKFLYKAVEVLRGNGKRFYIKKGLQPYDVDGILTADETTAEKHYLKR